MKAAVAIVLWFAFALCAHAQEMPDAERGRFTFQQVPEGMLRLDGRTGQVSLCSKRAVGWACEAVPEERTALESEIARLQAENGALRLELAARGVPAPNGGKTPPSAKPDEDIKWPSDADLDRAMSFLERAWRRLVDMVQKLQRDMESQKGTKPLDRNDPEKKG
jgi:hypothetical protein